MVNIEVVDAARAQTDRDYTGKVRLAARQAWS
jgi:hypothetical protein